MTVPYTFGNANSPIPLSNLDDNFTALGNSTNVTFTQTGANAVVRTVQNKLQDSVSVMDFGATGNGITDDSPFINAAVAALSSGGTLYFPPGTYLLKSQQIKLASNIKYIGAGKEATTISLGTNGSFYPSGFSNYNGSSVSFVSISDMTINGNYSTVADGGNDNYQIGIYAYLVQDSIFERINFKNIWYVGIEIDFFANRNIVRNCTFTNVGDKHTIVGPTGYYYCVGTDNGTIGTVIDSNIMTNCGYGVSMNADGSATCQGVTVTNNKIYSPKGQLVFGRNTVVGLIVSHNYAYNLGAAFVEIYENSGVPSSSGYSNEIHVINNVIDGVNTLSYSGLFAIAITAYSGVIVSNNTITNANNLSGSTGGININGSSVYTPIGAIISNNYLEGKFHIYEAIRLNGGTQHLVSANIINGDSVATGITVVSGVTNSTLSYNKFINCATNISNSNNTTIIQGVSLSAAPTTGTWSVGTIVNNSAPASAGYIGWVCTVAGTPGTWKTFGLIS
jgi:hypothetical protein